MKKHKLINKTISIALTFICVSTAGLLTGCGQETMVVEEQVELVEPTTEAVTSAVAEYRTMYSSEVYSAICCPVVEEYSFDKSTSFSEYSAMPGNTVTAGQAIMMGNVEDSKERIENMQESIAQMEEDYAENLTYRKKDLWKAKEKEQQYQDILDTLAADLRTRDPNFELNDDYQYRMYEAQHAAAKIALDNLELSMKRERELYELDHKYLLKQLQDIKDVRDEAILYSKKDGVVVAEIAMDKGSWLDKGYAVAAVGDLSQKELRCEFINQGVLRQAQEVYAIVNGERIEVEYQALDADTYKSLKNKNDVVYATFKILGDDSKVQIGDYAVIVIIKDYRNNVLCVPKDAVYYDENGSYVFLYANEYYDKLYVHTGMVEGAYVEILSGLSEGDQVRTDQVFTPGSNEQKVTLGSLSGTFEESGFLFYPTTEWMTNTVKYGTVYVDEVCVSNYEQVHVGQPLLKVHVVPDSIEIERQERTLYRQQTRLAKLVKEDEDRTEKQNERQIKSMNKSIAEMEKTLSEMKENAARIEIVSTMDGVITDLTGKKAGDLLQRDERVARIADQTKCFVLVEDKDGRLSYGNEALISYKDGSGASMTATGMVVSANRMCLSKDLNQGYALISVPEESISSMAGSTRSSDGWWNRNRFKVTVKIRQMDNVLTIPKRALKDISGTTYVAVKQADGSVQRVSVVSGGADSTNCWIAEGLTEGMTICLE